ncbi:hypothetical protein B0H12DRAFT_1069148 [Mycena haematopus]|nr:hypothetical protein B0H12DRAFT_1069148 [Mycena haematopus]
MNPVQTPIFDGPDMIPPASGLEVVCAIPIGWRVEARTKQTASRPTPRARDPNMKRQLAVMTTANTQARDRAEKAAKANAKAKAATGHAKAPVPLAATRGKAPADTEDDTDSDSHSDSDGIEIVNTEARNVALATPAADLVVLGSASGSSASPATKRRVKYLKRYDLLLPPVTELDHAERASIVQQYFNRSPRLNDAARLQIDLFRRVFEDTRRDPNWAAEEECMVCLNSPPPKILLSCACRKKVFHIHCIKEWHEKEDAAFQKLVQCPQCKEGAKPVHLAWATPTAAELAAKKAKKKVAHRAKGKEKRATLAREVRAKEKAVQKAKAKATQVAATTAALAPATAALAGMAAGPFATAALAPATAGMAAGPFATAALAPATAGMAAGPFMTDTATGSGDTATGSGHYVAPGLLLQAGVLYYRK